MASASTRRSRRAAAQSSCAGARFECADATQLPLPDGHVDAILVDLPFGKRHKGSLPLSQLYALAAAELCRVCRAGGVMVALTTHKHLLSRVVRDEPRWQPVARHELSFGGLTAYVVVAKKRA